MNVEPNRFFYQRNRLRVTNPPGGRTNDIFNTSSSESTPSNSPQKTKNSAKSHVFSNDGDIDSNGNIKRSSMSPRHNENTKERLFGTPESSPRRAVVSDTYRSHVFVEGEGDKHKNSPKKKTISTTLEETISDWSVSEAPPIEVEFIQAPSWVKANRQ